MELIFFIVLPVLFLAACFWFRIQPNLKIGWLPIGGFFVILIGSVFGREFFAIESGPIPITLDRILLVGLLGLMAWRVIGREESIRPFNALDVVLIAWAVLITWSTVTHDWKYLSNMPASRLLFFNLMPLALYFLVRHSKVNVRDLKWVAVMMGVFGGYLALTALAEVRELSAVVFPRYIMSSDTIEFLGRGRGPFLNPVSNGIVQTVCFCCILMWWPRVNRVQKVLLLAGALVVSLGIYSTLTRSVWLGLIVACGLFIWIPAKRELKGAMVIAATIIGIAAFPVVGEKIFSFKRDKEVSVDEMAMSAQMRPMFAAVAWNMFKDRPVTGVGFGQYSQTKHPYLRDPHSTKPLTITKSLMQHNVFLAYLTETGLIGLLCLTLMLMLMAKTCWDIWSIESLNLWARQFGLLGCVLLACYCINGMFHDVSIIPMQHMLMFFLVGLANNILTDQNSFAVVPAEKPNAGLSRTVDSQSRGVTNNSSGFDNASYS